MNSFPALSSAHPHYCLHVYTYVCEPEELCTPAAMGRSLRGDSIASPLFQIPPVPSSLYISRKEEKLAKGQRVSRECFHCDREVICGVGDFVGDQLDSIDHSTLKFFTYLFRKRAAIFYLFDSRHYFLYFSSFNDFISLSLSLSLSLLYFLPLFLFFFLSFFFFSTFLLCHCLSLFSLSLPLPPSHSLFLPCSLIHSLVLFLSLSISLVLCHCLSHFLSFSLSFSFFPFFLSLSTFLSLYVPFLPVPDSSTAWHKSIKRVVIMNT
ncbi:unnamed protein product [Acanthosepion pharaonis]|uniref:Uncharacterized protein n=1 Tax=Acanthosepion pharaonis TaxID=158019 RepID=A0A812DI36_ACAPH|nr:unnamed protein product [Sepia pharaonis]